METKNRQGVQRGENDTCVLCSLTGLAGEISERYNDFRITYLREMHGQ